MAEQSSLILRVADAQEAVAALEQARMAGCAAVLESSPRVAEVQGAAWFLALAALAAERVPGVPVKTLVDCGDAAALAHDALMRGADAVRFSGSAKAARKLREIAKGKGAVLLTGNKTLSG